MLIDAHTHLDHYDAAALTTALAEIAEHRILTVAVSMNPASYVHTRVIAAGNALVLPCFGVHPWEAHRYADDLTALVPLMAESPLLGEVGLDYVWDEDPSHYPAQRAVLTAFLQHAAEEDKLVNLHTKGAEHDTVALLDRFRVRRAIVHWYAGPHDAFDALIARGCWFTFGVETRHSPLIQALAREAPPDRILTETDGPEGLRWLTGEVGMPHHLFEVLEALANVRGRSVAEMEASVAANWRRLVETDERLQRP